MSQTLTFKTEKDLDRIAPPDRPGPGEKPKPLIVMHQTEPGLGVRIMPPTAKAYAAWVASKKRGSPPARRVWFVRIGMDREKIGEYPAMTLEEAKLQAITLRREAVQARVQGTPRGSDTVGDAVESFRQLKAPTWSEDTRINFEKRIEYLKPKTPGDKHTAHTENGVWNVKLRKLRTRQLQALFSEITAKASQTNLKRGLPGDGRAQAAAVGRLLYAALNHAVDMNMISWNPMRPIKAAIFEAGSRRRQRHLKIQDIPRFWHWLEEHAPVDTRDFVLTALFMCLRKSVAGSLTWAQVDTKRWTLTVPSDTRGNKARKTFAHPIPDFLIKEVFEPRLKSPDKHPVWVFPSTSRDKRRKGVEPLKDVRSALEGLYKLTSTGRCKRCRPSEDAEPIRIAPHDWRRSFGTWFHRATNGNELLTRRALAHSLLAAGEMDATSAGYIVSAIEELRDGMNRTVKFVLDIVRNPKKVDEEAYEVSAEWVSQLFRRDKRLTEDQA